jgi:hypothetical protein
LTVGTILPTGFAPIHFSIELFLAVYPSRGDNLPVRLAAAISSGVRGGNGGQAHHTSLAFAECVSPDPDNSFQVWQARLRLMEAAKRVYPIFLKKLSADVFPLYGKLAKEGKLAEGRNVSLQAKWELKAPNLDVEVANQL